MQHSLDPIIADQRDLLAFRGLAHDPQGILTAVRQNAFVNIKLCLNIGTLELGVAPFTHANGRRGSLYDPQFALLHDCSLAHSAREGVALWISNGTTT